MVRHIVMWKLREDTQENKAVQIATTKKMLEDLVGKIDGLERMEVHPEVKGGAYDMCLYSEYVDMAALDFYVTHPLHQEVVAYLKGIVAERAACDMEI